MLHDTLFWSLLAYQVLGVLVVKSQASAAIMYWALSGAARAAVGFMLKSFQHLELVLSLCSAWVCCQRHWAMHGRGLQLLSLSP